MDDRSNRSKKNTEDSDDKDGNEGFLLRGGNRRTLSIDTVLSLLQDGRRRILLFVVRNARGRAVPLDTVVEEILADEGPQMAGTPDEARESIRVTLLHSHIPQLEDAGVVEHNEEDGTLQYHQDPVLEAYLKVTEELSGF